MGVASASQLGVPAGAVAPGHSEGLLTAREAPALFLGELVPIAAVALAIPHVIA